MRSLPLLGKVSVSKNLPLRDRLPRYGGGGACARGGAVPRRGGGREPCHSPKYFGQPYSSLPHRLRAEPPRRGGQGVSTPFSTVWPSPSGEGVCGPARRRMRDACAEIACLRQAAENCGGVKAPRPTSDDTVRCRAACPHAAAVIAPFFRSSPRSIPRQETAD